MDEIDLQYREATLDVIVGQARDDLNGAWQSLLSDPVERAAEGMREILPEVAETYGDLAADNALIWYEDMRPASAARFTPRGFASPKLKDATGLATWSATPLFHGLEDEAWERFDGTIQQLVTGFDRETIQKNAERDTATQGWKRVASAEACAFCAYMAVVVVDDAPDKYHDHCRCVAIPVFSGVEIPEQPNEEEWRQTFGYAYGQIDREREQIPDYWRLRSGERARKYPEYSLTTDNILARARRISPDLFTDGVRSAA